MLFAGVAIAATFADSPGRYVADNRFEQFFNPGRRLAHFFNVWDSSRGLGDIREDVWLGSTAPVALLRMLGLSPAWTVRLWHAMCLVTAALGAVAVVRLFRRRIGTEHVLTGLFVAFGPFSATFLVPSNLYLAFALSPWMLVAFYRGVTEDRPTRWAAVFALLVLWAGNADLPGVLYALVPIVVTALYLVVIRRSPPARRVLAWLAGTAVLTLACNAWVIWKSIVAGPRLSLRLTESELPAVSAETSSWPESFRGLGNWLSYFVAGGQQIKPQGVGYFANALVLILTFAVPIAALVGLFLLRGRSRVLLAMLMFASLVLLVGGFGRPDPSPIGRAILWSLQSFTAVGAFRNTYKAAAGLVIGSAALASLLVVHARNVGRGRTRHAPAILASVVLLGVSFPFWTGQLYHPDERSGTVPAYWTEAFTYLDALPKGGRTFIVPAASRAEYRWGMVGDDIFDALLARPHATATGVPQSGQLTANLLEVLTRASQDPYYQPGVIGPIARRLGITEIVVRNDLDWRELGVARPSSYRGLRGDADLELAAAFGRPGENVVVLSEQSAEASYESTLRPVEVYRLREASGYVRAGAFSRPIVVAGDGWAWPDLARLGLLDGDEPVLHSGMISDGQLAEALGDGGRVVITDTARRRMRTLLDYEPDYSFTLGPGQELDRPIPDLFPDVSAAETVVWYPDAARISGPYPRLQGSRADGRPSMAFDGDPTTFWYLSAIEFLADRTMLVELREPTTISSVALEALVGLNGRSTINSVLLRFSDGSEVTVDIGRDGSAVLEFTARTVTSIELEIVGVDQSAGQVGLRDVLIPGLDLREFVQVPDDITRRLDGDGSSHTYAEAASYLFRRATSPTSRVAPGLGDVRAIDEERTIRRRFKIIGAQPRDLTGELRLAPDVDDEVLDRIIDRPVGAYSSTRLSGYGLSAVDGDDSTAWVGVTSGGAPLQVRSSDPITTVEVVSRASVWASAVRRVEITAGSETSILELSPSQCDGPTGCAWRGTIEVPVGARRFDLSLDELAGGVGNEALFAISEIIINGNANQPIDRDANLLERCRDLGLRIGTNLEDLRAIPVRVSGSVGDVLDGEPFEFESCAPVELTPGWQLLDSAEGGVFDQVLIASSQLFVTDATQWSAPLDFIENSPSSVRADTVADGPTLMILGASYDPRWRLDVNGRRAAGPVAYNGLNGWVVDGEGPVQLEFEFEPQTILQVSVLITAISVVLCVVCIVGPSRGQAGSITLRRQWDATLVRLSRRRREQVFLSPGLVVLITAAGYLLLGIYFLPLGLAVLLARHAPRRLNSVALVPPILLAVSAVASVVADWPSADSVNFGFVLRRPLANEFAIVAAAFMLVAIVVAGAEERARSVSDLIRTRAPAYPFSTFRDAYLRAREHPDIVTVAGVSAALGFLLDRAPSLIERRVVANLRLGVDFVAGLPLDQTIREVSVLPALIGAFAPLPNRLLTAMTCGAAAALATVLLRAALPRHCWSLVVGGTIGAALALNGSLTAALAASAVSAALLLANPAALTPARSAAVGILLACAVLTQTTSAVVVVGVGIWWGADPRGRRLGWIGAACFLPTVMPWLMYVWSIDGLRWPGGAGGSMAAAAAGISPAAATLIVRLVQQRRRALSPG